MSFHILTSSTASPGGSPRRNRPRAPASYEFPILLAAKGKETPGAAFRGERRTRRQPPNPAGRTSRSLGAQPPVSASWVPTGGSPARAAASNGPSRGRSSGVPAAARASRRAPPGTGARGAGGLTRGSGQGSLTHQVRRGRRGLGGTWKTQPHGDRGRDSSAVRPNQVRELRDQTRVPGLRRSLRPRRAAWRPGRSTPAAPLCPAPIPANAPPPAPPTHTPRPAAPRTSTPRPRGSAHAAPFLLGSASAPTVAGLHPAPPPTLPL